MNTALMNTLDTVLDRSVAVGYSRVGHALRSRGWSTVDPAPGSMTGRRVAVTGAGSGLGEATARALAGLGATVHLVVRDEERGRLAAERIRRAVPEADLVLERCDVADLADVRRFAADLAARVERLDVLVHNAGTLPAERTESVDGHELIVATHVLGPVLMTELLVPVLDRANARVVLVSSGGMYAQRLPADDPDYLKGRYHGATAYARSKRMQVALTPVLQERWGHRGITVVSMHPGWADTPGVASSLPLFRAVTRPFLRDAEAGADTVVWLSATDRPLRGGTFWHDRVERPAHYFPRTRETPEERQRLWSWVLTQTGLDGR
jgi:NAD(P)-dependent dehydrogenase (short-subunit alcohol dehydrogenase family)